LPHPMLARHAHSTFHQAVPMAPWFAAVDPAAIPPHIAALAARQAAAEAQARATIAAAMAGRQGEGGGQGQGQGVGQPAPDPLGPGEPGNKWRSWLQGGHGLRPARRVVHPMRSLVAERSQVLQVGERGVKKRRFLRALCVACVWAVCVCGVCAVCVRCACGEAPCAQWYAWGTQQLRVVVRLDFSRRASRQQLQLGLPSSPRWLASICPPSALCSRRSSQRRSPWCPCRPAWASSHGPVGCVSQPHHDSCTLSNQIPWAMLSTIDTSCLAAVPLLRTNIRMP
jgi:hypothetical protein